MKELWEDYLQYLIWRCGLQEFRGWGGLFGFLHNIEFIYILDRDGNRYDDGIRLRDDYEIPEEFADGYNNYDDLINEFMDKPCSVFEMLIALSIRVDDEFIGDPKEEHPEEFFMIMLRNLRLDKFRNCSRECGDIISVWLDRRFDRDGRGSPFPLKRPIGNQRDVEIWDQMMAYINENY